MKKFIIILIFPFIIFSQDENENINLETVNIYGSLIDLNNFETGKNVTIISSKQIQEYSFNSIDELLKLVPSIEIQSRGGFGNQSDLALRGTTFNQTLVVLDGVRVNDPLTGHFSMYIPINPHEIYQIEIIRGAGSSIYGPDAVGGVINIVTKSFSNEFNDDELILESKFGSNNLNNINLYFSKKFGDKLHTTISLSKIKSDGQELYDSLENIYSFFDHQLFSISQNYQPTKKLNLNFRYSYSINDFNSQYYYTRNPYDRSSETVKKNWAQFNSTYKINEHSKLVFQNVYKRANDLFIFNPDFPPFNENKTDLINNKLYYFKKSDRYNLVYGLDYQSRKINSIDRGNHDDSYFGSFINFVLKPREGVRYRGEESNYGFYFNPSLRLDYNESYSLQYSPQMDLNYNQKNYNLRVSIGKTIRAADFTERFSNNNKLTLSPGRNLGNPDLDSEKSINFEIGVDYKRFKNISFKNTIFYRNSTDLIDWVATNSNQIATSVDLEENAEYLYAQNISKLNTLGLESEIWFNLFTENTLKINGTLGYTKIFSSEKIENLFNNDIELSSKYLVNNSGDRFNYNLFFNLKNVRLNFNGILKVRGSEMDPDVSIFLSDSYFVHNLNLSYQISKEFSCKLEMLNIFNEDYSDIFGAIMPRRWFIFGVNYFINN